jgi:hypothetical protein
MHIRLKLLAITGSTLLLAACAGVRPGLEPGAEAVNLLPEARVRDCEHLGTVEVSVLERFLGMDRHEDQVEADLANLARNHAVERNGDAVAALGRVRDGKQRFGIYRCGDAGPGQARSEDEGVETRAYER